MDFKEPFIETVSGKRMNPLNPKLEDIDIYDIAHALAMKCRFTGHTKEFYSVAQHSIWVSLMCPIQDKLAGLLHDSAEAYLSDLAGPVKPHIPRFKEIEEQLLKCIFSKYDVAWPLSNKIKEIDERMLMTEGHHFMNNPSSWGVKAQRYNLHLQPWSIDSAKKAFIDRFNFFSFLCTHPYPTCP